MRKSYLRIPCKSAAAAVCFPPVSLCLSVSVVEFGLAFCSMFLSVLHVSMVKPCLLPEFDMLYT